MEIILLERIKKLGQIGDTVTVKDGFARNFLLPQGKALRANKANIARFENERSQIEAKNLEHKKEADKVAEKLGGQQFIAIRQSSDTGQLYGSVNSRDIAKILGEEKFTINRSQIVLNNPIKTLGIHPVQVSLHPEVDVTIEMNVARTAEEAELQAKGEDVLNMDEDDKASDETDAALEKEEIFEDEALANMEKAEATEDEASASQEPAAEDTDSKEETAETEEEGA